MRRLWFLVSALAVLMPTILMPGTASASVAFQAHFRGQSAFALFSSNDPVDPCIVTEAFVFATEGRVQEPPGPPTSDAFAFTVIARFYVCTGEVLLAAFGETTVLDFQGDRRLATASLAATMTVEDIVSGTFFNVSFDLTWTGTGGHTRLNQHIHSQEPGLIAIFHVNEAARQAAATGSVSDGAMDFTAGEPAVIAEIGWFSSGSVDVAIG